MNNTACPYFWTEIFCQRYFINSLKGCTTELNAQFGENMLSGKTADFSTLGVDVKAWQNVALKVVNKKVSISINGAEAFYTAYQQSCGMITGIAFVSKGLCDVDFVDLKTTAGKTIYSNDFGH